VKRAAGSCWAPVCCVKQAAAEGGPGLPREHLRKTMPFTGAGVAVLCVFAGCRRHEGWPTSSSTTCGPRASATGSSSQVQRGGNRWVMQGGLWMGLDN